MYLNCKTYFSFLYGTYSTKGLVDAAVQQGVTSLALTNINSTCDIWDFVKYCREAGIKPIVGAEIRNDDKLLYILLAANNRGFQWINEFLSLHLIDKKPFPEPGPKQSFFTDIWDGFVIYPLGAKNLDDLLPNERIGVLPSELTKLFGVDLAKFQDRFVIRQPVTVQDRRYHNLHRLLRAIDKNCLLSKLPGQAQCQPTEIFISPDELLSQLRGYPFLVTNTYKLMDSCHIQMEFFADKNKR